MTEEARGASGDRDDAGDVGSPPVPPRLVGQYRITRQIGRGGMAVVYLARQETLDRDVALKELRTLHASEPEMAERFLRESRLAGSLNHPNIVTVFEYFEDEGTPYIAMEYVPRGSLRPYVGCLSLAQLAGVMEGVLAGLAHAEPYGIVHRDLKPENLMVTEDGRVKIADFGIAKATQTAGTARFLTATGTTVGTPTYMAPEQAMGRDIGMWTDLYSVGVMAWEHVVGRVPFHDSDAPMVILMRHVNEEIPAAIEVNPEAHRALSEWIERLLVKDPDGRTRSPTVAWDELEEIVIQEAGPRWRREARLPSESEVRETPRPLTPAPFESTKARTPKPGARPVAEGVVDESGAEDEDSGYVTFGRTEEPREGDREPPPPAAPVEAEARGPVIEPAAPPPASEPATPASAEAQEAPQGYITFGRPPEPAPPAEVEPPPPEPPPPEPPPPEPPPPEPPSAEPVIAPEPTVEPVVEPAAEPSVEPAEEATPEPEPSAEATSEPDAAAPPADDTKATEPDAVQKRRIPGGVRVGAAVVLAAAVAAALGFLVAPSSNRPARPQAALVGSASAGPLGISLPAGWQRQSASATPYVKLANEIAIAGARPSAGTLLVGTTSGGGSTLLPASLLASLTGTPTPQVVTLGQAQFYRYLDLAPRGAGAPADVYAVPTTAGTVIGICLLGGAASTFASDCERVVGTLRLSAGNILGIGPNASLAAGLKDTVARLNSALTPDGASLSRAGKPRDQASAANQLAAAYEQAASSIQHLQPVPAAASAVAALAGALRSTGRSFADLARAASHNDGHGYNAARASIASGTAATSSAFAQLQRLGYVAS